jgi:hypothetical protein
MIGEFKTTERWTLSADRASLTIDREDRSPMGNAQRHYFYRRA